MKLFKRSSRARLAVPSRVIVNAPPPEGWPAEFDPRPYDTPAWERMGKPHPLRLRPQYVSETPDPQALPAFLRRQAG